MNLYRAYFVPSGFDPRGTEWWWPGKLIGNGIGSAIAGCYPKHLPPPGPCDGTLSDAEEKVYDLCILICETIPIDNPISLCDRCKKTFGGKLDQGSTGGLPTYLCKHACEFVEKQIGLPDIKTLACKAICCGGKLPNGLPGDQCWTSIFDSNGNQLDKEDAFAGCKKCCDTEYRVLGVTNASENNYCTERCQFWSEPK